MSNLLEIRNLSVSSGGINAVKDINLDVPEGQIVTLIGANGAGKSTVLRTISGLVKTKTGSVTYEGKELLGKSPDYIVSQGVTLVPEGRRVFTDLTVLENLKIGAYLRKDNIEPDIEYVYSLFPRLKERAWQFAGTLSGGEQQMLAMGRALMSKPKLMMLDEPSMGLSPLLVQQIFDIIKELNEAGTTILLVEQNAKMALSIADRAYVLETGKVVMEGNAKDMLSDESVKKAYLGG